MFKQSVVVSLLSALTLASFFIRKRMKDECRLNQLLL